MKAQGQKPPFYVIVLHMYADVQTENCLSWLLNVQMLIKTSYKTLLQQMKDGSAVIAQKLSSSHDLKSKFDECVATSK
jgi:hypothetical protein